MGANARVVSGNGTIGAVQSYTITDTTTPTSMANLANEVPSVSLNLDQVAGSDLLNQNGIVVGNADIGDFYATVDSVTDAPTVLVEAVGLLGPLNAEIVAPPIGAPNTLSVAYATYIGLAYSTPPTLVYSATSNPVVNYPAFGGPGQGTLWEFLKQLGAITHTQIVERGNTIVIQDMPTTASHSTLSVINLVGDDVQREITTPSLATYCTITQTNAKSVTSFGGTIVNYSTNPSLETNATGWSAGARPTGFYLTVGGTVTASGRTTSSGYSGSASFQATVTDNPNASGSPSFHEDYIAFYQTVPVGALVAGTAVYVSEAMYYTQTVFPSSIASATLSLSWRDAANNVLTSSQVNVTVSGNNTWIIPTATDIVPAGAVNCIVCVIMGRSYQNGPYVAVTGIQMLADALLFTAGGVTAYFDGNSVGGSWVGTANNSVSQKSIGGGSTAFYDALADNNNIITVASGQISTTLVQSTNYATAILQPSYALILPISPGQYSVSDSNGLILTASQWLASAPNPTVSLTSIPGQLAITFTGPTSGLDIVGTVGPYSLSANVGFGNNATFSVAGIGVTTSPVINTLFTGADSTKTQNTTPVDLSSPFIQNSTDVYTVYADAMADLAGPVIVATLTVPETSALGLGGTPGSLATYAYGKYRASTVTDVDGSATVTALPYLKDTDFDAIWGNTGSILDTLFDARWGSGKYTSNDFGVKPLWR